MANNPNASDNLKPFKKGDPRINRRGRPRSFDAVRALAQAISHEVATKGDQPIVIEGHVATVAEMILRQWASSKNPTLQQAFIAYAFGKVPDKSELSGKDGGKIEQEITFTDESVLRKLLPELASDGTTSAAIEPE